MDSNNVVLSWFKTSNYHCDKSRTLIINWACHVVTWLNMGNRYWRSNYKVASCLVYLLPGSLGMSFALYLFILFTRIVKGVENVRLIYKRRVTVLVGGWKKEKISILIVSTLLLVRLRRGAKSNIYRNLNIDRWFLCGESRFGSGNIYFFFFF